MAVTYNRYLNSIDHTWYDSTNVLYSKCYDRSQQTKTLKVVFKQGRTYLYKDVSVDDYICFKTAESNGSALNTFIVKKYQGVRLPDTDLDELQKMMDEFMNETSEIEKSTSNILYHMDINEQTGEFRLSLNGKVLYEGKENNVSIMKLFNSMHVGYSLGELTEPLKTEDVLDREFMEEK